MSYPSFPDHGQPYGSPAYSGTGVPPLDQPYYGIGPVAAVKRVFQKYAVFAGRASRSEFWWWTLALNVLIVVLTVPVILVAIATSPDGGETPGTPGIVLGVMLFLLLLGVIVPNIAITVRRLHDAGFSGWFYLLNLIPYVGALTVLILCVMPSQPAGARYHAGGQGYGQPSGYGQSYGGPPDPYAQSYRAQPYPPSPQGPYDQPRP